MFTSDAEIANITCHLTWLSLHYENPVNSCFTATLSKIHHGPVIAPFSVQILKFLLLLPLSTVEVLY